MGEKKELQNAIVEWYSKPGTFMFGKHDNLYVAPGTFSREGIIREALRYSPLHPMIDAPLPQWAVNVIFNKRLSNRGKLFVLNEHNTQIAASMHGEMGLEQLSNYKEQVRLGLTSKFAGHDL